MQYLIQSFFKLVLSVVPSSSSLRSSYSSQVCYGSSMASFQYLVRSGSCSSRTRSHGYSKAQFNLLKILHLISTIPPAPKLAEISAFSISRDNSQLDLNLRLGLSLELGESESFGENETDSSAVESNVQRSTRNVVVLQEQGFNEEEAVVENSEDVSHVANSQQHVQVESFEVDHPAGTGRVGGEQRNEDGEFEDDNDIVEAASLKINKQNGKDFAFGCGGGVRSHNGSNDEDGFELLIKAAKLISGTKPELVSEEEEASVRNELSEKAGTGRGRKKENSSTSANHVVDCCVDLEENSPVVRSKRGRNQSLPYRYRDSVMQPLKRSGSRRQPQRQPSTSVSRKRASRS